MLLGAIDVTPMEAAQMYNGLANGGFRTPLRAVRAVISADGKNIRAFPLQVAAVATPENIYQVDRMMEQVRHAVETGVLMKVSTHSSASAFLAGLVISTTPRMDV